MNYSKADKEFNILKFAKKQLLVKKLEPIENGFIINDTYSPATDGFTIYPKEMTGAVRDEIADDRFIEINPKHQSYMKYGPTQLLMLIYGLNKEQAKNKALKLINNNYEDEAEQEEDSSKFEISNLDYDAFSKYLITTYKMIKIDKSLYRYDNGVFLVIDDESMEFLIMDNLNNSKISHRKEIARYIQKNTPKKKQCDSRYILFENCIYDIKTKKVEPINDEYVFLNKIPSNYNPTAEYDPMVEKFLDDISCNDVEVKTLIVQFIGYCMYRKNPLGKFFIFKGLGGNGKSTLFDFIEFVIGEDNVSKMTLEDLSGQFGVGVIRNKLVNLGDDIEDKYIEKVSNIKKLTTGETIAVEEKYQAKQYFKYYGKLGFSANNLPRMSDKSDGLRRRLIVIPLDADFKNTTKADPDILEKICTPRGAEYATRIAIEQLHDVLDNKKFVSCQKAIQATEEYHRENNPILAFLDEYNVDNEPVAKCYNTYLFTCKDDANRPLSKVMFSKRIQAEGYISTDVFRDGKTQKVFKKIKK